MEGRNSSVCVSAAVARVEYQLVWVPVLVLLFAGCLPSSCHRVESRDVTPADSLSRRIAAQMVPDTLRLVRRMTGEAGEMLDYPRTVRFGSANHLYISDARRNSVFVFAEDGTVRKEITWEGASVPYLAGLQGDTLFVFSPEVHRLDVLVDGVLVHSIPTPDAVAPGALQYAVAQNEGVYVKVVTKGAAATITRLDGDGVVVAQATMPGPYWQHAGLLRLWGDSLLSLSGFRPVMEVLARDLSPPPDTLALVGFDSPMLRRTYAFMQGDTRQAPLLSSSAVPVDSVLFVLNMRPGWLRIDVYNRMGRLQHILVERNPAYNKQFYPIDLAVQARDPGVYEIAVAVIEPVPEVRLYRWDGLAGE